MQEILIIKIRFKINLSLLYIDKLNFQIINNYKINNIIPKNKILFLIVSIFKEQLNMRLVKIIIY